MLGELTLMKEIAQNHHVSLDLVTTSVAAKDA